MTCLMKKHLMNYFVLPFLVLIVLSGVRAEDYSGIPGAFASVDIGARSSGLAGAQTANPSPAEALLFNPASIYDAAWSTGYAYSDVFGLISYNNGAGSYRIAGSPWAVAGAYIQNGDDVYSENELFAAGAWAWKNYRLGATWKLRYSSTGSEGTDFIIEGSNRRVSGSGLGLSGFDFGAKAVYFNEKLIFGVVVKDVLSVVAWSTENDARTAKGDYTEFVPMSARFGGEAVITDYIRFSMDMEPGLYSMPKPLKLPFLEVFSDTKNKFYAGLEVRPFLPFSSISLLQNLLLLRAGYSQVLFEKDDAYLFAFGAGLRVPFGNWGGLAPVAAVDFGYQINTIFEGHNSPRLGLSVWSK